jgi:ATP-dependent Clp protease protease subunit
MKKEHKYFNVVAHEKTDSADLYLYGYIGSQDWWGGKEEKDLTDLAIINKMNELEGKFNRINIHINSYGGDMKHGNAIINAIKHSTSEIHCYNDGIAASMAANIWFAASHRHMATNALLMMHAAITAEWGNAKALRKAADLADKFTDTIVLGITEATDMSEEEVREKWYNDYEDHWLNHKEVDELNLITENEAYEAEEVISGIENMSFNDIAKHFASNEDVEATGLLKQIQNIFHAAQNAFRGAKPTKNNHEMNLEELKQSVKDGDLTVEDLQSVITENNPAPPAANNTDDPPEAKPDIAKMVNDAVEKAVKPLNDKIAEQAETIKNLGDEPGSGLTKPSAKDGDDFSDNSEGADYQDLNAVNSVFGKAAKERSSVRFK